MFYTLCIIILVGIRDASSQNEGDECIVERTNVRGVCTESSKCQTATNEYQLSGIMPTFCTHNFDTILVCCSDNRKIFDTAPIGRRLISLRIEGNDDKSLNNKEGQECVVNHTKVRGVCTLSSNCKTAAEDLQYNGIQPTFCTHNFDTILVCCSDNRKIFDTAPVVRQQVSNRHGNGDGNLRISERKCEEYSRFVTEVVRFIAPVSEPEKINISVPKCNYEYLELIIGGEVAEQGEFPHMAAIGWVDVTDNFVFRCGGSLISSRFILSAGHCTSKPDKTLKDPLPKIVRLRDHNLDVDVDDNADPIDVPIKIIHKLPDYASPSKYDDIALFELNSDVTFTTDMRPACLWPKPDFQGYTKAIATGWGVVDPRRPTMTANELRKVSLNLLETDFCNRTLKDRTNRNWGGFSDGQLCAGELLGGKDTCQGDSGSPLQIASTNNKCVFYIIGVTSFGKGCAVAGTPGVYTRVSHYLDWIESIVWPGE